MKAELKAVWLVLKWVDWKVETKVAMLAEWTVD